MSSSSPGNAPQSSSSGQHQHQSPPDEEEDLRRALRKHLRSIERREPLEPTYKHLLINKAGGVRAPPIIRDRLYKKLTSDLRFRVESYVAMGGDNRPMKRGRDRDDLEDGAMRAAFTLRESKHHEQEALVSAALAAPLPGRVAGGGGMDEISRRKRLEGMAIGLQERDRKEKAERARLAVIAAEARAKKVAAAEREKAAVAAAAAAAAEKEKAAAAAKKNRINELIRKKEEEIKHKQEELERKRKQRELEIEEQERLRTIERARERERQRELERKEQEEKERLRLEKFKEEEERKRRLNETPKEALHRLYEPIFTYLWDMEFEILHDTNPFRIVIDKENCEAMGVPDYCDVIKQPMNLTYIQTKVNHKSYETLQEFFADVELMLSNALIYNSDPYNEFHLAAKEMKKKYKKMAKRVVLSLQQQQQQQHSREKQEGGEEGGE